MCDSMICGTAYASIGAGASLGPSYHRQTARPHTGANDSPLCALGRRSVAKSFEHDWRDHRGAIGQKERRSYIQCPSRAPKIGTSAFVVGIALSTFADNRTGASR